MTFKPPFSQKLFHDSYTETIYLDHLKIDCEGISRGKKTARKLLLAEYFPICALLKYIYLIMNASCNATFYRCFYKKLIVF